MDYRLPTTIDEAIALLSDGSRTIVAGGTDFFPARAGRPALDSVVDISKVEPLRGIEMTSDGVRIGALTTWSEIRSADLPPAFHGLQLAAAEVGGIQVQNVGTVAGNLCNASPAADGVPPLLTLDAGVEVAGAGGRRIVPLTEFITGYRQTALVPGELVTAVVVPAPPTRARSTFSKLGSRRYLVISIVMVAVMISLDDEGRVALARVAVGAAGPVASRLIALEERLVGAPGSDLADAVHPGQFGDLNPIDDVRAPAAYRTEVAVTMTRRALRRLEVR